MQVYEGEFLAEYSTNFCNMLVEVNKQSEIKITNPTSIPIQTPAETRTPLKSLCQESLKKTVGIKKEKRACKKVYGLKKMMCCSFCFTFLLCSTK